MEEEWMEEDWIWDEFELVHGWSPMAIPKHGIRYHPLSKNTNVAISDFASVQLPLQHHHKIVSRKFFNKWENDNRRHGCRQGQIHIHTSISGISLQTTSSFDEHDTRFFVHPPQFPVGTSASLMSTIGFPETSVRPRLRLFSSRLSWTKMCGGSSEDMQRRRWNRVDHSCCRCFLHVKAPVSWDRSLIRSDCRVPGGNGI